MKSNHQTQFLKDVLKFYTSPNKWCKGTKNGSGETSNGRKCLIMAMGHIRDNCSTKNYKTFEDVRKRIFSTIRDLYSDRAYEGSFSILSFNDHPKTTFKDVKKVLARTLKSYK